MKTEKTKSRASDSAGALPSGTQAPDFRLPTTPNQFVSLCSFLGAPIVLVLYPAEWSPVGGDEVELNYELLPEFCNDQAALLGISVDGVSYHLAFAKDWKQQIHCWPTLSRTARSAGPTALTATKKESANEPYL